MKQIISHILFSFLLFLPFNLYGQISHSIKFKLQDLKLSANRAEDNVDYQIVSINESGLVSDRVGSPSLPVKYVNLIIPPLSIAGKVKIRVVKDEIINISKKVFPVQKPIITSIHYKKEEFIKPDSSIYEADRLYPADIVRITNEGNFAGNKIITLAVNIVQYNPKKNILVFNYDVDFEIELKTGSKIIQQVKNRTQENQFLYDRVLEKLVNNPENIPSYQVKPFQLFDKQSISGGEHYDYVIITTNDLVPAFDKFVKWKSRKGLRVLIKPINEILSEYPNGDEISGIDDDAGSVRQYLNDLYYANGLLYALFAGNDIPIRYGCGWKWGSWGDPPDYPYKIPTDLYFGDFDSQWNPDEDIYYGKLPTQYGGGPLDYYQEIFVGRLLCSSTQEVENWVGKVIKYEQNPGNGDILYLNKSFLVASDEFAQYGEGMLGDAIDDLYDELQSIYNTTHWKELPSGDDPSPTFPTGAQVINELNNRYGLISLYGHGAPYISVVKSEGLNVTHRYTINALESIEGYYPGQISESGDYLGALTNENYPSIIYSIGCDQMPFDYYHPDGYLYEKNLAEAFTVLNKSGGPAFLGNTRWGIVSVTTPIQYSLSHYNYLRFLYFISSGIVETISGQAYTHLGVSEFRSKIPGDPIEHPNEHYVTLSHNLIGCPETQIWLGNPTQFTNVIVTDGGSSITVNAGTSNCNINVQSANGESYNFTASDVTSYSFDTSIRPLYITVNKSQYIPFTGITGGTINTDLTLWGKLNVLGNLTIASGKTLTIEPGTFLNFASSCSLIVNGTLTANGVTFDRSATSGIWQGIIFDGYSASNSILDNVEIKYAKQIESINSADVTIQNSSIENGTHGIYIYNAEPQIINNKILENSGNGIYGEANGKSPVIKRNDIKKSSMSDQGIYFLNYTDPYISNNDIKGYIYGIYLGGGGYGYLTEEDFVTPTINNRITNNYYGLTVAYGSCLAAGLQPNYPFYGGLNSIWNNTYDAYAYQNGAIIAKRNWWGADGAQTKIASGGSIDASSPSTIDPWALNPPPKMNFVVNKPSEKTNLTLDANPDTSLADIYIGIMLEMEGRIDEAVDHYKQMINKDVHAGFAFSSLAKIRNKFSRGDIETYFDNVSTKSNLRSELKLVAANLRASMHLNKGNYNEAVNLYDHIINQSPDSHQGVNARFEKFLAALHIKKDKELAGKLLSEIQSLPNDDEDFLMRLETAEYLLYGNEFGSSNQPEFSKQNQNTISNILPIEYSLLGNYPNPFNPSTSISYTLPYQSSVELIIYDVMGREIKSFNNISQNAGIQNIVWDGRNSNGENISSGIYLYRLKLKSLETTDVFEASAKLMMLK